MGGVLTFFRIGGSWGAEPPKIDIFFPHFLSQKTFIMISTTEDLELNQQQTPTLLSQEEIKRIAKIETAMLTTYVLILFIVFGPFIVCDLYYGYNDTTCVNKDSPMAITLHTYLIVSGYSALSFVGFNALATILATKNSSQEGVDGPCILLMLVITVLFSSFKFAWTIVGAFAFWKYTEPSECSHAVSNYLWAQLIMYFIGIYIQMVFSKSVTTKTTKK
jgi:hypothetical protein